MTVKLIGVIALLAPIFAYAQPSPLQITGQLEGYTFGEQVLVGYTFESSGVLGSGIIKSDGRFEFSFPDTSSETIEVMTFDNLWCSGFDVMPSDARGIFVHVLGVTAESQSPGGLALASSLEVAKILLNDTEEKPEKSATLEQLVVPDALARWIYVDRDVHLKGICQTLIPQEVDIELEKGWTMLVIETINGRSKILTEPSVTLHWYWLEPN